MNSVGEQMGSVISEYRSVMQLVMRQLEKDEDLVTKEDCVKFLESWIGKVDVLGRVLSGL